MNQQPEEVLKFNRLRRRHACIIQIHSSNEEGRFIKANDRNQKRAMMLRRTAIYRKYADRSNPVSAVLVLGMVR